MPHLHNDTLLRSVLDILDPEEELHVRHHIDVCPDCRGRFQAMRTEVAELGSVEIDAASPVSPVGLKQLTWTGWMRTAAMIVFAFLLGFMLSDWMRPDAVTVEQQLVTAKPADRLTTAYVTCEQVDL